MQDLYRMELGYTNSVGERIPENKDARHNIGILVLFCTFVEVWMEFLLRTIMRSHCLSDSIADRLLSDNQTLDRRIGKLFKSLTDQAFGDALRDLNPKKRGECGSLDYEDVWRRVRKLPRLSRFAAEKWKIQWIFRRKSFVVSPAISKTACSADLPPLQPVFIA
jgi:hypothetical protein